jgi:anti-sigma B factor antagonist
VTQDLLSVSVERTGDSTTVRVAGEIDLTTVPLVSDPVRRVLERRDAASVTLDLREVSFIDLRGLRMVIMANRLARRNGCRLRVLCGGAMRRLIELTDQPMLCDG